MSWSFFTAGDVNHDGRADVFVCAPPRVELYLSTPGDSFRLHYWFDVWAEATSMVVADMNGDSHPDLVVGNGAGDCYFSQRTISILYGQGDGSFRKGPDVDAAGEPFNVAAADFNGDGLMDLAAGSSCSGMVVIPAVAPGQFGTPHAIVEWFGAATLSVGDLNQDGAPDVVASARDPLVMVCLNSGSGTFSGTQHVLSTVSATVAIGDLNGDGAPELAATDGATGSVGVAFNRGGGSFFPFSEQPMGWFRSQLALADWDGDGHPKVAVVHGGWGATEVRLYPWTAAGAFGSPTAIPVQAPAMTPIACDYDSDSHPEIATLVGASADGQTQMISILKRLNNGSWRSIARSVAFPESYEMATADFDADARPDFAVVLRQTGKVAILHSQRNASFGPRVDLDTGEGRVTSVVCGDVNGDGRADVVTRENANPNRVEVFLSRGEAGFAPGVAIPQTQVLGSIALADLNCDGRLDLIEGVSNAVVTRLGVGNGSFSAPRETAVAGTFSKLVAADLDRDGVPDVALIRIGGKSIVVLLGNGDGTLRRSCELGLPFTPLSISAADMNADGSSDLVLTDRRFDWNGDRLEMLPGIAVSPPVVVQGFQAAVLSGWVHLQWRLAVAACQPIESLRVQRALEESGPFTDCTPYPLSPEREMNFDDVTAPSADVLWYRLVLHWKSGIETVAGPIEAQRANTGSSQTSLRVPFDDQGPGPIQFFYTLREEHAEVLLAIYDVRGRWLCRLETGRQGPGAGSVLWDRRDAAGGVVGCGLYLVQLRAGSERATSKLVVLHR